jgi:hypothetical protein
MTRRCLSNKRSNTEGYHHSEWQEICELIEDIEDIEDIIK